MVGIHNTISFDEFKKILKGNRNEFEKFKRFEVLKIAYLSKSKENGIMIKMML
ncbi:MAG: hypothetical protein GF329_06720 [Candidatus Lokiarchaeota archaeon]|nr:hypothetical protein [Candidatus Lokiarchaeota archaeon]